MSENQQPMDVNEAVRKSWAHFGLPAELPPCDFQSLLDVLEDAVSHFPNNPAVTSLGGTLSFAELDTLSTRFAAYLQQHTQLKPGDRLAIQMPSLIQYLVVAYGAFKAGLVVVNINPMYTEVELDYQLNHAGVKAVVVFDRFLGIVEAVRDQTPVETVFVTSPFDFHPPVKRRLMSVVLKLMGKSVKPGRAIPLQQVFAEAAGAEYQPVELTLDDMALLQYTGGTTGVSKPAIISHGNMVNVTRQAWALLEMSGLERGKERIVSPLPLYHIYAFALSVTTGVYIGAHSLLVPNPRDIKGFVKLLRRWPATLFSGLNTLFVALLKHPDFNRIDFSGLKITLSGGSALASGTGKAWQDKTGCEISEAYGLTEASPIVSFSPRGSGKAGSVGIAVPETELRIVDDEGRPLAVDEHGELWVRGPQVMSGYLDFPEETANTITDEGWLKTGDIASVDRDGFLRIHDRKKDMISVSGFNVYPNEIENVVSHHPDISYCAVVGVPDEHSGEAVKLYLVSTNPKLTADDMHDYCAKQLARYKLPKYIEFRDELPLSNVGKVLRRELRDS
ncbi:AMP-binding protein [Porticoccus sp.]|uniref:AMP-binding protein n=1 Tax=Porticoccus sp. TaxID=2024853 RepID=UPI003F695BFE